MVFKLAISYSNYTTKTVPNSTLSDYQRFNKKRSVRYRTLRSKSDTFLLNMLASLKQIVHSHFIAYRITIHVFLYAERSN